MTGIKDSLCQCCGDLEIAPERPDLKLCRRCLGIAKTMVFVLNRGIVKLEGVPVKGQSREGSPKIIIPSGVNFDALKNKARL